MTDQPRDLAAEVERVATFWGDRPEIKTLLQHIAALSRELSELKEQRTEYLETNAQVNKMLNEIGPQWLADRKALAVLRAPVTAENYGPTLAAEINALPDRLRRYVIDLEQRADPAWDVRRAFLAEEKAVALEARVLELEVAIARLRVHLPAMIQHPDEAIRLAADTIAAALVEAGQ